MYLKWVTDFITGQNEELHNSFDTNKLWSSGVYPISIDGSLNPTTMNYPDLVNNFSWLRTWSFENFRGWLPEGMVGQSSNLPLFVGIIEANVQTYLN